MGGDDRTDASDDSSRWIPTTASARDRGRHVRGVDARRRDPRPRDRHPDSSARAASDVPGWTSRGRHPRGRQIPGTRGRPTPIAMVVARPSSANPRRSSPRDPPSTPPPPPPRRRPSAPSRRRPDPDVPASTARRAEHLKHPSPVTSLSWRPSPSARAAPHPGGGGADDGVRRRRDSRLDPTARGIRRRRARIARARPRVRRAGGRANERGGSPRGVRRAVGAGGCTGLPTRGDVPGTARRSEETGSSAACGDGTARAWLIDRRDRGSARAPRAHAWRTAPFRSARGVRLSVETRAAFASTRAPTWAC